MLFKSAVKSVLGVLGKGETKVAAVFGISPEPCHAAVLHLKSGAPDVPIWLFAHAEPLPETKELCQQVFVSNDSLSLFVQAQVRLWPYCVAISVGTWTAEHGHWPLKLAPFLIQPFRVVLLNSWGGFFSGGSAHVLVHWYRFVFGAALSTWVRITELGIGCCHSGPVRRVQDVAAACWLLISHHIWRSGPVRRLGHVVAGFSLYSLAKVMTWFSQPHRDWFRRIHGVEPLELDESCADYTEAKVESFVQTGQGWDACGFAEFVQSSDARWIHWRQDGREAEPEPDAVAQLFADSRTFAVARQSEATGWKSALFPMAPFRHLQPGMASQVLAPISSSIWVDRSKLAALGIPDAQLTHTAWMLLFWKAAAAGWRCYSLAEEQQGGQQADFPAQETESFLRLCADSELRRLGPVAPDLSRGTIAFAPDRQLPFRSGRLRVLVVSPFLPFPLSHGGAVRIFNLCRELADRVDFILIAVREQHDIVQYDELYRVFRHVYTVDLDEGGAADKTLPIQVRAAQSASLRALIADVSEQLQPDLLQIEFTHMAGYRDCAPQVAALLVEHDLTFKLYYQLAQTERSQAARAEYQRWLDFERHWLASYDAVWTMSHQDRTEAIRAGSSSRQTFVIANGVDTERFARRSRSDVGNDGDEQIQKHELLYVGSFRHLPNILGFQKLCREVMPRVWRLVPDARLRVVAGAQHAFFWNRLTKEETMDADPRIEILDFLEDLRPLYEQATVVVVPLEVSAGTNIKVLEAMACGKAVVSTPIGCAGLGLEDDHDIFIRDGWEAFAGAVCETLLNAPLRSSIGSQARRTVEAQYRWSEIAHTAYLSYQRILAAAGSNARGAATQRLLSA